ncbi:MAG: hypothetical protein ABFD54_04520 [Armatimonadota bacterium]
MSFLSKLGKAIVGGGVGFLTGGPAGAVVGAAGALSADRANEKQQAAINSANKASADATTYARNTATDSANNIRSLVNGGGTGSGNIAESLRSTGANAAQRTLSGANRYAQTLKDAYNQNAERTIMDTQRETNLFKDAINNNLNSYKDTVKTQTDDAMQQALASAGDVRKSIAGYGDETRDAAKYLTDTANTTADDLRKKASELTIGYTTVGNQGTSALADALKRYQTEAVAPNTAELDAAHRLNTDLLTEAGKVARNQAIATGNNGSLSRSSGEQLLADQLTRKNLAGENVDYATNVAGARSAAQDRLSNTISQALAAGEYGANTQLNAEGTAANILNSGAAQNASIKSALDSEAARLGLTTEQYISDLVNNTKQNGTNANINAALTSAQLGSNADQLAYESMLGANDKANTLRLGGVTTGETAKYAADQTANSYLADSANAADELKYKSELAIADILNGNASTTGNWDITSALKNAQLKTDAANSNATEIGNILAALLKVNQNKDNKLIAATA